MGKNNPILLFIAVIVVIILLYPFPGTAIQKYSFRMRSLGPNLSGFVDDLYSDLYFNPAYIYRFNKHHIYTNLSNLQGSGQTRLFGSQNTNINKDAVFPSNLIGYVGPLWGRKWGIFWENSGHSFEQTDREEFDSPAGRGYRGFRSQTIDGKFSGQGLSFFALIKGVGVNVTYDRVGLDLGWNSTRDSLFYTSTDTSLSHITHDKQHWKFPNNFWGISLGKVWRTRENEWSVSGGIQPHRINLNMDQLFNLVQVNFADNMRVFRQPFSQGSADESDALLDQQLGFSELGVRSYFARARYKQIRIRENSFHQINYLMEYVRYKLPLELTTTSTFKKDSVTFNPQRATYFTQDDVFPGDGQFKLNNFTFGVGGESYFDNLKTMVAMGVKLSYIWGNLDVGQGPGRRMISNLRKIGSEVDSSNSYTETISDNTVVMTRGDTKWLTLSLPIGLQLKPHKNFTLRLGANTTLPLMFKGSWNITTKDSPNTVVDSSGAFPPIEGEAEVDKKKSSSIKGKLMNLTSYYYGASITITPTIDIEIMNYADVTNLHTWWLSIVFRH